MAITGVVTNRATGGQFILKFGLRGPNVTAIAERVKLSFDEDPAIYVNAIKRWKDREFNKKLPMYAKRVLTERSGALMSSQLDIVSTSHQRGGGLTSRGGTTLVHLKMNMAGASKAYGAEQEVGRAPNTVRSAGHYLVPVASQWGQERVTSAKIRAALSDKNVRWLPYGRYAQDSAGRPIKWVFRFDNIRDKALRSAAASKRARGKVTRRKEDVKKSLREQGSMLFIAYKPPFTTGIPGASGGAFTPLAGKGRKLTSPVVRNFGFSTIAGRQASRWFSYTLIKTLPTLDSYLERETGKIKGAKGIAVGTSTTGSAVFYE